MRYTWASGSTDNPGRIAAERHRNVEKGHTTPCRRPGAQLHHQRTGRDTRRFCPLPSNPAAPVQPRTAQERRKRPVDAPQPPPLRRSPEPPERLIAPFPCVSCRPGTDRPAAPEPPLPFTEITSHDTSTPHEGL